MLWMVHIHAAISVLASLTNTLKCMDCPHWQRLSCDQRRQSYFKITPLKLNLGQFYCISVTEQINFQGKQMIFLHENIQFLELIPATADNLTTRWWVHRKINSWSCIIIISYPLMNLPLMTVWYLQMRFVRDETPAIENIAITDIKTIDDSLWKQLMVPLCLASQYRSHINHHSTYTV